MNGKKSSLHSSLVTQQTALVFSLQILIYDLDSAIVPPAQEAKEKQIKIEHYDGYYESSLETAPFLKIPGPLTPPPSPPPPPIPLWNFKFYPWGRGMDIFLNHTVASNYKLSFIKVTLITSDSEDY